jgi:hypothetical protein
MNDLVDLEHRCIRLAQHCVNPTKRERLLAIAAEIRQIVGQCRSRIGDGESTMDAVALAVMAKFGPTAHRLVATLATPAA